MLANHSSTNVIDRISDIIGNPYLASDIYDSISLALKTPHVVLGRFTNEIDVFNGSLNAAIRDIEKDPKGILFQRLLLYGPHNPDDPIAETSDGKTILSDPECGDCVEFIFSHMINRFQGELGELLALGSCIHLVEQLKQTGELPQEAILFWGNTVQERHQVDGAWRNYLKGADGLVVNKTAASDSTGKRLEICAVIEIKSMAYSYTKIMKQIDHHLDRFYGGLKLDGEQYEAGQLVVHRESIHKVMVRPSRWKVIREWEMREEDGVTNILFAEPTLPPVQPRIERKENNTWKIMLDWSDDALRQAAFEMTFGYMAQVGEVVFKGDNLPKEWSEMTPSEAGYNAIKMMLYYMIIRIGNYYSAIQRKNSLKVIKAIRLYNIYSFGYPIGADHKKMLWWEEGKLVEGF